jgi:CheY-like chemotaxis protein
VKDKLHILVVEDDELDRMIIKRALDGADMNTEVIFAESMESGRKAVVGRNYDCIFIDYNLPGGNGLELMKYIRESGNSSPVIVVTSQGDERIAVEIMKNGAADYITKNMLTAESLKQILRHIFRLRESEGEKTRFEKALQNTQKTLQTVVANAPVILFSIDTHGILTMLEGKGISDFDLDRKSYLTPESENADRTLPISAAALKRSLSGKDVKDVIKRKGKFYEVMYSPMLNHDDEIIGVMGVATDVTLHKLAEEQLLTEKSIAEETARIKQQFLANMSHEIRTPMNGIIGLSDIMLRTKLDEEQKKYIQSIINCSDNLLVIINDILDLSKIEAGRMTIEKMPFHLHDIIENSLSMFSGIASKKNIKLSAVCSDNVPQFLVGDSVRLSQVLNNLIDNALKFTPSGEVALNVSCAIETPDNASLVFTVQDSGIGISKENCETIFESFTQASSDTARKYGGTGLGLTIVRKLLEMQGGSISLNSIEGKGSAFTFNISYPKATEKEIESLRRTSSTVAIPDLSNLHVLIAEDNEMNRMIIQKHFKDWKIKFKVAENGNEVVELVKQHTFDLILMDIQMPIMDGYDATKIIRNTLPQQKAGVPIIAVTAHATNTERVKCLEAGMNDYLSKPFRSEDLLKKICGFMDGRVNIPESRKEKISAASEKKETSSFQFRVVDMDYLRRVAVNEPQFIQEMISIFLQRTPEALRTIRDSINAKDMQTVWQTAHRMKPTFSYMGMKNTSVLAADLEKLCKNTPDEVKAEFLLGNIEYDFNIAQSLIEKEFLVTR